jgi:HAD superfamily 5'-nucleotidase-like hydrolase
MHASSGPAWSASDDPDGEVSPQRRIFTNRNLRMNSLDAIGFDMDHTLAVYNTPNFNKLCFDLALERLVEMYGYPEATRDIVWDADATVRGLIVDKRLGNLLKVDAYQHVTRARHGLHFLEKDQLRERYPRGGVRLGSKRYRVFDTLFDLPEGCIYSGLIELKSQGHQLDHLDNITIYDDIRRAVDTLHADGSLKSRIMADLDSYFLLDPNLVPTLEKFRKTGKKLFLLTNSEADYTAAVMNHLVGGAPGSWVDLFDLVVCFARKPGFFLKGEDGVPVPRHEFPLMPNLHDRCFVGGDSFFLEKKLGVGGDEILYFGDHTYGDILRSKRSVGWRTAMIVPEVEEEVSALLPLRGTWQELAEVEDELEGLVMARDHHKALGRMPAADLAELEGRISAQLGRRANLQRTLKGAFNRHWQSVFREGRAASRFGRQVLEFACIYTSRVSNFLSYPSDKFFARPVEVLPHERWALPEA